MDLIFAPQVSKESKLSVYDLDDESETGKVGSVQVFDLGESSSEDKLGKPKAGPATKVTIFLLVLFNKLVHIQKKNINVRLVIFKYLFASYKFL